MSRETITVSLIGYNEAKNLSLCLESLTWVDEIIFVDCESQDNSLEIARQYTSKVFSQPNVRNLNINKQFGIDHSSSSWIMYLDPDEIIPPDTARWIKETIQKSAHDAYFFPRKNYMLGDWLKYGRQYPDYQLRLFRRGKARFPCKHIHERLEVTGSTGKSSFPLLHYPYPTLEQVINKFNFYTTFDAIFLDENKPSKFAGINFLLIKPLSRFIKRYFLYRGFLDGFSGFVAAFFDMINFPVRYLKYIEIKHTGRKETKDKKDKS